MKIYLNRIDGWDDAIISMFLSKRTLTRELELEIRNEVADFTRSMSTADGLPIGSIWFYSEALRDWLEKLFKWCPHHITMGRFLDFSFTVYGMHRAGQDDIDSHAKRMENRIIRSSTRLADFSQGEMSEVYEGKIIPTDAALAILGITAPEELEYEGQTYVKGVNGYILKGMENNRDVKRGLYMLSIPSNFIFKMNLTEFAHLYKERNKNGTANQEVKDCVESAVDQLERASLGYINRDLLLAIKN
jgi:hypothetical protein